MKKLLHKIKKTYAKMLSAYARRKLAKAYELEDKAILLELELIDERKRRQAKTDQHKEVQRKL